MARKMPKGGPKRGPYVQTQRARKMPGKSVAVGGTEVIKEKVSTEFGAVRCAFLELAEPSIPDGISQCVDDGANEVIVLPYFLSAGRHVAEDIPSEVEQARSHHPDVCITITDYLGAIATIPDLIATQAIQAIHDNA